MPTNTFRTGSPPWQTASASQMTWANFASSSRCSTSPYLGGRAPMWSLRWVIAFVVTLHIKSYGCKAAFTWGDMRQGHASCAPCGPIAFTWPVCMFASQANRSLAVSKEGLSATSSSVHYYVDIILINLNG